MAENPVLSKDGQSDQVEKTSEPRFRALRGTVFLNDSKRDLAAFLQEKGILASLRLSVRAPKVVALIVAVDDQDRVAVLPAGLNVEETTQFIEEAQKVEQLLSVVLQPGPSLAELAQQIAKHFCAEVKIGSHWISELKDPVKQTSQAFRIKPLRALEVSKQDCSAVPLAANSLNVKVWFNSTVIPDTTVVMFEDTQKLDQWKDYLPSDQPCIELTWGRADDAENRTLTEGRLLFCPDGDEDHWINHSWAKQVMFVWGQRALSELSDSEVDLCKESRLPLVVVDALTDLVGPTALVQCIAQHFPDADTEAMRKGLLRCGHSGFSQFVSALGINKQLLEFLLYQRPADQVEDAVAFEPRGLYNALGHSLDMMLDDEAQSPGTLWGIYHNLAVHRPWVVRALVAVEFLTAMGIFCFSLPKKSSSRPRRPWLTLISILLSLDSIAELLLLDSLRRRKDKE